MFNFLFSISLGLFDAFIMTKIWSWLLVPALHFPILPFYGAYGIMLIFDLLNVGNLSKDQYEHLLLDAEEQNHRVMRILFIRTILSCMIFAFAYLVFVIAF